MTYEETLQYLYDSVPMFQRIGGAAYKPGLDTTYTLDAHFGHPHTAFRTIHVAGTNGKGSVSHSLAAVLQSAGYKVGLFTSPHLIDFRERIRVNGEPVCKDFVTEFVERERPFFEPLRPSFFELTTAMAFCWFRQQNVDVAVVEVGLGGRLDCTNIISPDLSVITNISFDHVQFLGDTLGKIAGEKAGIIKHETPVVIGETQDETRPVFLAKAEAEAAPICFADTEHTQVPVGTDFELKGIYQKKNQQTIITALAVLRDKCGYRISDDNIRLGLSHVVELTGLMGRWQRLRSNPTVICDIGHNSGGIAYVAEQLRQQTCRTLRIVFGMVSDKDVRAALHLMPRHAVYYFTRADVKRALPEAELQHIAEGEGLSGRSFPNVTEAVTAALRESIPDDLVFIGGSNYVVADLLSNRQALNL